MGKTRGEGTEFPPDLLIDLLGPAVSVLESSRAGRNLQTEDFGFV